MRIIISIIFLLFFNHAQGGCLQKILASGEDVKRSERMHGDGAAKSVHFVFNNHEFNVGLVSLTIYNISDPIGKLILIQDGALIDSYEHAVDISTGKSYSIHCEVRTCKKVYYQGALYIYYPSDLGGSFERVLEKDGEPYGVLRIFTEESVTSLEELFADYTCNEPYNEEVYQFLMEALE